MKTSSRKGPAGEGPTHKFDLPHSMRKQQTVWAEGAHFGTHLAKHRLCSIRTCQTSFAT